MRIDTEQGSLRLSGGFDGRSAAEVRTALDDLLTHSDHEVVVDLSGIDGVDVTALRMLAATTRRAASEGRRVVLRGSPPCVRRLLHRTRLIRMVELERSLV